MKMKRFMAIFMAALFISNAVPFFMLDLKLQAAVNMTASFDSNLAESPASDTPSINYNSSDIPGDTVHLQYPVNGSTDSYTLTYLFRENVRVDFEVTLNPVTSVATGRFRVFNLISGVWTKDPAFNPFVYRHVPSPPEYLTATNYIASAGSASDTKVVQDLTPLADGYYFEFERNKGFIIKYGNHHVYFMMDENFNIHYTTHGLQEGIIYNFYLVRTDTLNDQYLEAHMPVFMGLNSQTVDYIPVVSDYDDSVTDPADFNTFPLRSDNYQLLYNGDPVIPADPERPAGVRPAATDTDVGLAIRFDEPISYDFTMPAIDAMLTQPVPANQGSYSQSVDAPDPTKMEIGVELEMDHNMDGAAATTVGVTANNILGLNRAPADGVVKSSAHEFANALPITTEPRAVFSTYGTTLNATDINNNSYISYLGPAAAGTPGRIQILLYKLAPSMMFSNVSLRSTLYQRRAGAGTQQKQGISKTYGAQPALGKVYTFLDYGFLYDGVRFSLQFAPYKGFPGRYRVVVGPSKTPEYTFDSDGESFVSMDIRNLLQKIYQVQFKPDAISDTGFNWNTDAAYSEITEYDPSKATIDLGAGQNFRIEEFRLKPLESYLNPDHYGNEGTLDLTLSWQMGFKEAIEAMYANVSPSPLVIKYALKKSLTGDKDDTNSFAYVYLEINQSGSDYLYDYFIFKHTSGLDQATFESSSFNPLAYDNPTFLLNKSFGDPLNVLATDDAMYRVTIDLEDIPAERGYNVNDNSDGIIFYYEKIYFLTVETMPENLVDKKSNFDSMSLSDIVRGQVPPVKNVKQVPYVDSRGKNEFLMNWVVPGDQLYNYFFATPYKPEEANYNFNVFISQDENEMKDLAKLSKDQLIQYIDDADVNHKQLYKDYSLFPIGDPAHKGDSSYDFDISPYIGTLRADDIFIIEGLRADRDTVADIINRKVDSLPWALEVKGLDENQTYYVYVTLEVCHMADPDDPDMSSANLIDKQTSILSVLIGITTKADPDKPDGEDNRPPAPVVQIKDVKIDTATVFWDNAVEPIGSETIHYEVIRTKTDQIPSKFIDNYVEFPELYDLLKLDMPHTEMVILETPTTASGGLRTWNPTTRAFIPVSGSEFVLTITPSGVEIVDKTLTSNEIYYYYVRTVKVTEKGKTIVSVFNYNTCTTTPVDTPINLKILEEYEWDYDPETEFVINFDAPITNLAALGVDYNFQAALKVDDEEFGEAFTLDAGILRNNKPRESNLEGLDNYYNFTYKITGLKPGTMYSVKVRIINIKTNDMSAWSNIARTRTTVNQDDYFDEKSVGDWLDYYKEMLNLLIKNPYWPIQDTKSKFSAVYRPTMFGDVLSGTSDGSILLPTGDEGASSFSYYLPASSLAAANGANKGFTLSYNDVEVIISPKTVSTDTNESIIDMINRLDKKQIADYYLLISIEYKAYNQNVHNNPPLSDNIDISIELVSAREKAIDFDNKVLQEYITKIEAELKREYVYNELMSMVKNDVISENMIKYLTNMSRSFKYSLIGSSYTTFRQGTSGTTKVKALDSSLIISLKNADVTTNATGYRWESSQWNAIDTFAFGNGKAFYTNTAGSYIFAGVKIVIDGAETLPGALTAYTIISKYGLTDFLGYEGQINLDGVVTRKTMLGCATRIMGAAKGSDPVQYLKENGYVISGAGIENAATSQETVYVVMAVYEARTRVKVETLQVKNYMALNGVTGLNERYTPYIRAAHELGIYNAENMSPRSTINVRQLLDMLTALDKRANL